MTETIDPYDVRSAIQSRRMLPRRRLLATRYIETILSPAAVQRITPRHLTRRVNDVQKSALVVAAAVLSALVGGGTSTAIAQGNRPRTEAVSGMFTGSPVNARQRVCQGQDGAYLEIRGHFSGTITDPRLTGTLDFMAEPALVNLTTGLGTFRGRFRVSEAATGKQTAQGEFFTVVTEASLNHGFALGHLTNAGNGPTDSFFATFESTFDLALNVSGHFGGTGDPRLPAVVQGGQCSGPFTQVP